VRSRIVAAVIIIVCGSLLAAGCTSDRHPLPTPSSSGFTGMWVDKDDDSHWLVVEPVDGGYRVTTEMADESGPNSRPAPSSVTLTLDYGRLVVPAKISFTGTELTCKLVPGGIEALTQVEVQGLGNTVDTTLTITLVRGTATAHQEYLDGLVSAYRQQLLADAYSAAMSTLESGIRRWSDSHGGMYPPPSAVREGGAVGALLKKLGKPWPTLPNGTPLRPGRKDGQYVYKQSPSGYALTLFGPGGQASTTGTTDGG
jgi:hypothetical protein